MWAGKYIGIERYSSNGDYYSEFNGMNIEAVADPGFSKGGTGIKRHRREDRGAVGAEVVGCGAGVSPPHWVGVWGEGTARSSEK